MKKHSINLTEEQRQSLQQVVTSGKAAAREIQHAHVLLKSDEGAPDPSWTYGQIKEAFGVSISTIWRIRKRFEEQGLQVALQRAPQPERPHKRKIDGEGEAHLLAIACGPAPAGQVRWTLKLLTERLIELGYLDEVSLQTVSVTLKKMS
jgi:hypothetical protein